MRKPILIVAVLLLCVKGATAQTPPSAQQPQADAVFGSAKAPLAPREADYIRIVETARKQYAGSRSVDGRKTTRINFQIAVHDFMGLSHNAKGWVGVFKGSKRTHEGLLSMDIEIAPGVSISTMDNAETDVSYDTLVKPYISVGKAIGGLSIGDVVTFSANLIGSVISTDDDMVLHPQLIAQFSELRKLEDAPSKN